MIIRVSKNHMLYSMTFRCPISGCWPIVARIYKPDGTRHSFMTGPLLMDQSAVAECPKCNQRWMVLAGASLPSTPSNLSFIFVETERTEEALGDERRQIDNSKSSVELTRRLTIGREWTQSYTLDREKVRSDHSELKVGGAELPSLTLAAENTLKERYSITSSVKQTYEEEITVVVPQRTSLTLVFHWKRLWQHGNIQAYRANKIFFEMPFKVAVGLTFDQTQNEN